MKRITTIFLSIIIILSLTGCTKVNDNSSTIANENANSGATQKAN